MTTPESSTPNPEAEPTLLVTFIPDINKIQIDGLGEEPQYLKVSSASTVETYSQRLSQLYLTLGKGTFNVDEVKEVTDLRPAVISSSLFRMGTLLPDEVMAYDRQGENRQISLGEFAIASRRATEEELVARTIERQKKVSRLLAEKKAATEAAEAEKTDISEADHALITANGQRYYLPLTSSDALLAVRTIQALPSVEVSNNHGMSELTDLAAKTWGLMPLAERQLFTKSEADLYGNGQGVRDQVAKAASQVAGPLDLIHRGRVGSVFYVADNLKLDVQIHMEPPVTPYDASEVKPVYPPGTEKHIVQQNTLSTVTEEQIAEITTVLDRLLINTRLTQSQSLEVLDLITDRRSKVLARRILTDRHGPEAAETLLEALDNNAQNALGYSNYYDARRQRTIRGEKGAGRIQQIGGRLQGDKTFRHVGEGQPAVTGRWYFGKRSE